VQKANANLADTFFSHERITRWAEMADEAFDVLVADMTEMAKASKATSETVPGNHHHRGGSRKRRVHRWHHPIHRARASRPSPAPRR
jgi:hypothetical protein